MKSSNQHTVSIEKSIEIISSNNSLRAEMKRVGTSIFWALKSSWLCPEREEPCTIMKSYIEENQVPNRYTNILSDKVKEQLLNFRSDIIWSLHMSTKWEKKRNLPWFQIFFADPDRKILWNHDSMKEFLNYVFSHSFPEEDTPVRILNMCFAHSSIHNYRWNEENTLFVVNRLINLWESGEWLFRKFSGFTIKCDVENILTFQRMAKRTSKTDSSKNYAQRSLEGNCTPGLASFRG